MREQAVECSIPRDNSATALFLRIFFSLLVPRCCYYFCTMLFDADFSPPTSVLVAVCGWLCFLSAYYSCLVLLFCLFHCLALQCAHAWSSYWCHMLRVLAQLQQYSSHWQICISSPMSPSRSYPPAVAILSLTWSSSALRTLWSHCEGSAVCCKSSTPHLHWRIIEDRQALTGTLQARSTEENGLDSDMH